MRDVWGSVHTIRFVSMSQIYGTASIFYAVCITLISDAESGPSQASKYFLRSLSTNSKTRYRRPSLWTTSQSLTVVQFVLARILLLRDRQFRSLGTFLTYVTMFGWVSCLSTDISLKVVLGMPSSSSSRRILCIWNTLWRLLSGELRCHLTQSSLSVPSEPL